MLDPFRSLQRLVLFLSVLVCRCANAGSRSERQPAYIEPPEAVVLCIRPQHYLRFRGATLSLTVLPTRTATSNG